MKRHKQPFVIANTSIPPGQRRTVDIVVAKLYTRSDMYMNAHVVHGKSEGPVLFLSAAVHGDEINGVEIIRRVLGLKLLNSLRGTLIAVPVVNAFGFINASRYLPDRRDLNRFFPGSHKGSLTSRLAAIFMDEIVTRSHYGIDFHSGSNSRNNLPQIRAYLRDPAIRGMAKAFGTPVIIDAALRDGSLRQAALQKNVPVLLYEGGEAMRFDEVPIRVGVRGVIATMRHLNMLPAGKRSSKCISPIQASHSTWARAGGSGIFLPKVRLGEMVRRGDTLGRVTDPFNENTITTISPVTGMVIGQLESPPVQTGDAVIHIAAIEDMDAAEGVMDSFQREYEMDQLLTENIF